MSDDSPVSKLVRQLQLQPHPEGGYYRETFRSDIQVPFQGRSRCAATSIYYLLADGAWSAWHRIDADETWYFHTGTTPVALHVLSPDGALTTHRLGNPLEHGNLCPAADTTAAPKRGVALQAAVPAGSWFAAELEDPAGHALLGCSVSPGFEFSGFELADERDIQAAIERHGHWLRRLLKPLDTAPRQN